MYNSTSYTTQYFYSTLVNNGTTSQSYASNYSSSLFYKTTTTFVDAAEKTAYPIWVGWTGANAPTTQANIANATAAGTALPSHSPSTVAKSGLSTGASAGIGVGAGLGGLLILAAAVLGYRHRKKKLTKAEVPSHEKPELSEDATIKPKELPDVQEKRVHEADTIHPPVELG
jgi:hypothetical protein